MVSDVARSSLIARRSPTLMTGPMRNAITSGYTVNNECAPYLDPLKAMHQICRMPLYGADNNLDTRPDTWSDKLLGALVKVTFTLRHYHMVATATRPDASDTFSAKVESLSILAVPTPILESRFRENVSPRKPRHLPQTPTRSEQVNAARAFVPFPAGIPQLNFSLASTSSSPAPSAQGNRSVSTKVDARANGSESTSTIESSSSVEETSKASSTTASAAGRPESCTASEEEDVTEADGQMENGDATANEDTASTHDLKRKHSGKFHAILM